MKIKFFTFLTILITNYSCFAQKLNKIEFLSLKDMIGNFLSSNDSVYFEGRQSELITIILKIDSNGKVSAINLIGNKKDTSYTILSRMTTEEFKNWQCLLCKRKTIVLPYFYLSASNAKNFVDDLWDGFFSDRRQTYINKESEFSQKVGDIIITYFMFWLSPGK